MGILDRLSNLITTKPQANPTPALTARIVLGALLAIVARADGKVSPSEEEAKRDILSRRGYKTREEQDEIFKSVRQVLSEELDWESFTREINQTCIYSERVKIIEDLFAVAWADHELSHQELEAIRKIAGLMWIEHKDFINAKLSTKP